MKLKDDIEKWRNEIKILVKQTKNVCDKVEVSSLEIKTLNQQVLALAKITEEMAESIIALLSQQIGD